MSVIKDDLYWVTKAVTLSVNRSGHTIVDDNLPKIGAILVRGKHQVAQGVNLRKSHPIQEKWGVNPYAIFLHAEIATIINALRRDEDMTFSETTMYVGRAKKYLVHKRRGTNAVCGWGLSQPCSGCTEALKHYGINRVVYSIDGINGNVFDEINF